MEKVETDKYLGDIVSSCGTSHPTIMERMRKGYGIANEILSIIDEVPLGRHRAATAIKLREAMLINGILFNSEIWYGVKESDLNQIEKVDEYLLRGIIKAHSKTPRAALYLETGCIPIRYIIKKRRLMYLHHILHRNPNELIYKVYMAQKRKSVKGLRFIQTTYLDKF